MEPAKKHAHREVSLQRRMGAGIIITLIFVAGEMVAGLFSHSLALISDAGHNFTDALALAFSWYAMWIAAKPSDCKRTFGYHRVAILAALINAVSLVGIALVIFWEACNRLIAPHPIHSGPMIWVALIAVLMNVTIALWMKQGAKTDVNIRSTYLHMVGDAASAFGVVIAGIVIAITGRLIADPIASFVIGALILWSSWGILKETINTLLEGSPAGLNMGDLEQTIRAVPGIINVHDLHVWTVGPGVVACSCHVLVGEQSILSGQQILREVVEELEHHYRINHTTVQVEVKGCTSCDTFCRVEPNHVQPGHHGHSH